MAEFQVPPKNVAEEYIYATTLSSIPRTMTAREVEVTYKGDVELEKVRECISSGDFSTCNVAYRAVTDELPTIGYIVMRQIRVVILATLRKQVLSLAHSGHQGLVKTKSRLRGKVWWPGVSADCERFCKQCHGCQVVSQSNHPEPIQTTAQPEGLGRIWLWISWVHFQQDNIS